MAFKHMQESNTANKHHSSPRPMDLSRREPCPGNVTKQAGRHAQTLELPPLRYRPSSLELSPHSTNIAHWF
jgi:hypothetical protein